MEKVSSSIRITGQPLSESIFIELRSAILRGKLRPGEKLSEQQVCDKFGLSRTPVREAFRQLELEGLIETIPNRGAFVVGLSKRDIEDLYEMRKAYEILAVKWAIERITKEEMEKLEEAYEFMEFYTMKKEADKMLNINMQFHNLIYKASHNRMLEHTLSTYQFYLKETESNSAYLDGYLEEVLKEHKQIYDAFVEKDTEKGMAAAAMHLDNAKARAK
ncbi:MAG TPA: GntR family transcriptional regulator [Bacillota bacterium]|jgi:DNA-binding GntR family transcriptional regulator|nr:GntR family transcriptional regulator [Bacillota bacterium]HPZ60233.1 GntR family transcriptional regulator [Bacillota bacterium]